MRMYLLTFQSVLFAIYFFGLPGVQSIRWLAINNIKKPTSESGWAKFNCSSLNDKYKHRVFDKKQLKICKKRPTFMKYIAEAADLAISECKRQTFHERWYCNDAINQLPTISGDLRDGKRESAFVHALSTAALVFTITRSCATDKTCKCGKNPEKLRRRVRKRYRRWGWGKCHDNIAYGVQFSRDFLDAHMLRQKSRPPDKLMMILHNNDAARAAVRDSMAIDCECKNILEIRCVQVCTRRLTVSFSEIAKKLWKRYKKARQVSLQQMVEGEKKLVPKGGRRNSGSRKRKRKIKPVNVKELVYLDRSRDFCKAKHNLPGTSGRECARKVVNYEEVKRIETEKGSKYVLTKPINEILKQEDRCDHLCCGRPNIREIIGPQLVRCAHKFDPRIMDFRSKTCNQLSYVSTCR